MVISRSQSTPSSRTDRPPSGSTASRGGQAVTARPPVSSSGGRARQAIAAVLVGAAAWFPSPPLHAAEPSAAADGWRIEAQGPRLVLRGADGRVAKEYTTTALEGGPASPVAAVVHQPRRRSFVVAFTQLAELWEISLDPAADPIHDGLVHDYRMGEAIPKPGYLGVRRTKLPEPLCTIALDAASALVLGRGCAGGALHLVQLDVRRRIAGFVLAPEAAVR